MYTTPATQLNADFHLNYCYHACGSIHSLSSSRLFKPVDLSSLHFTLALSRLTLQSCPLTIPEVITEYYGRYLVRCGGRQVPTWSGSLHVKEYCGFLCQDTDHIYEAVRHFNFTDEVDGCTSNLSASNPGRTRYISVQNCLSQSFDMC